MSRHTTFRIGGPADYFIKIDNKCMLLDALRLFREEGLLLTKDYYVLGNGSNLLVADDGFRGIILSLGSDFSKCTMESSTIIKAGAAASFLRRKHPHSSPEHCLWIPEFHEQIRIL